MLSNFLSNYITSLSTFQQKDIHSVLSEVTVGKNQLDTIAKQLMGIGEFFPLIIEAETSGSGINAGDVQLKFRDVYTKYVLLFEVSNLISLLLDSHTATLTADIKSIEDELLSYQKMADNYGFLLADGATFDFSYLEPWTHTLGRDSFDFLVTDRNGTNFGLNENAIIHPDQGVLSLAPDVVVGQSIAGDIIKGNALGYTVTDSGIDNATSPQSSTSWQLQINSPTPISSAMREANGVVGAQVLCEFTMSSPSPCGQIEITPLADHAMDLLQVTVYVSQLDGQGVPLLASSIPLDRVLSLSFPTQPVQRFTLLLNQPTYVRTAELSDPGERLYTKLYNTIAARKLPNTVLSPNFVGLQGLQKLVRNYGYFKTFGVLPAASNIPYTTYNPTYGPLVLEDSLRSINNRDIYYIWEKYDEVQQQFLTLFSQQFPDWRLLFSLMGRDPKDVERNINTSRFTPSVASPNPGYMYEYTLGLQHIAVGTGVSDYRGVFVSKPMPAPGDIGQIKLKIDDWNYTVPNTTRNSPYVTSIEYSVSNLSQPTQESDWLSILPVGTSNVTAERFFPDDSGKGFLRFPAAANGSLTLYKNGYAISYTIITGPVPHLVQQTAQTALLPTVGLNIDPALVTPNDFFTVDYVPVADGTVVDLTNGGAFNQVPLITAYDQNGAGEGFLSTTERCTVTLNQTPYIDYTLVHNVTVSYQPLVVRLMDGTTAINLTDYTKTNQVALNQATGYYFLQSGKTLIFNQAITQPFRVFYKYLQNDVRVRIVLRVNDKNFVSPSVHYFHLKAKTRNPNPAGI